MKNIVVLTQIRNWEATTRNRGQRQKTWNPQVQNRPKQHRTKYNSQRRHHLILHFTVNNHIICVYFTHYIWRIHTFTNRLTWLPLLLHTSCFIPLFCSISQWFLDFKLSPCVKCNMFSFGCFPGVWVLIADVLEHSIGSIFIGSLMKYDRGWDVWGIYTGPGSGRSVAEPMGRWVAGWGVVRRGEVYKACAGGITWRWNW
jgi:hypothetical protein